MTAGRPPIPTALKELRGTVRPDRVNSAEPLPPLLEIGASPPGWVTDVRARRAWRELVELLGDANVATVVDSLALALLVDAFADYLAAKDDVERDGAYYWQVTERNGKLRRPHPALAVKASAWRRLERALGRFGMTPADRAVVKVAADAKRDPFEQWAAGGR